MRIYDRPAWMGFSPGVRIAPRSRRPNRRWQIAAALASAHRGIYVSERASGSDADARSDPAGPRHGGCAIGGCPRSLRRACRTARHCRQPQLQSGWEHYERETAPYEVRRTRSRTESPHEHRARDYATRHRQERFLGGPHAHGARWTVSAMTPERWKRLEEIFHAARGRDSGARAEYVAERVPG